MTCGINKFLFLSLMEDWDEGIQGLREGHGQKQTYRSRRHKKFSFRLEPVSRHTRSCPPLVVPKKNPPQNPPAPLPSLVARPKIFLTDKNPIPSPPPTRTKHVASSSNFPAKRWATLPITSLTPSSNASPTRSKASSLLLSNSVS